MDELYIYTTGVDNLLCWGLGGGPNAKLRWSDFQIFFFAWKIQKNDDGPLFPFFNFLDLFKAVGPKWVFQSFLWLHRKYSPIFTFDMSLQRYWIADFRIFENWKNLEKWAFYRKNRFLKYFFFLVLAIKWSIFFQSQWNSRNLYTLSFL